MPLPSAIELGWPPCAPEVAGCVDRAARSGTSDAADGYTS